MARPIDLPNGNRICTGCSQEQPIDRFDLDKNATRGRRSRCKSCRSAHMKAYYAANADRIKARMDDFRADNPERVAATERRRYLRNRDARIALAVEVAHRRRSRLADRPADEGITQASLRDRDGDACAYCSVELDFKRYRRGEAPANRATIDHVIPVARGGAHVWDNVVLACRLCNASKGAHLLDEWLGRKVAV